MSAIDRLRPLGRRVKAWRAREDAAFLDPVRRITRVALPGERLVAMTFDDGPTAAPARPGGSRPLTLVLAETLEQFGAAGTFNVIGSTAHGYPDRPGRPGTPYWNGVRYDHYPDFGADGEAGVAARPDLARRLVRGGHELANHSYAHLLFGPKPLVYRRRASFRGAAEAAADLIRLHELVERETGQTLRLARPPHYVDRTRDGRTAYDLFDWMGYAYLAASFDGGGWLPSSGDYRADVDAMVRPLERALAADADALCGQIVFQKDGYNMSRQAPVVDALPRQLERLAAAGYRVVTVSELCTLSPFSDLPPGGPVQAAAARLLHAGFAVAYRDNAVRPARRMTAAELAVTMLPRRAWLAVLGRRLGLEGEAPALRAWAAANAAPTWPAAPPAPPAAAGRARALYAAAWAFAHELRLWGRNAPRPAEGVDADRLRRAVAAWLDAAVAQGAMEGSQAQARWSAAGAALEAALEGAAARGGRARLRGEVLPALAEALAPAADAVPHAVSRASLR
ncbi:MAG: polysaccharide deacetylase family protein [Firmicutes bacterium]|nr:polysaccharide deacetylase family protein [Bacillota bacterium]